MNTSHEQSHPGTEPTCPESDRLHLLLENVNDPVYEAHVEGCTICLGLLEKLTALQEDDFSDRLRLASRDLSEKRTPYLESWKERTQETFARASEHVLSASHDRPEIPGYEILDEIGRGGVGVVFSARQLQLNRAVAIKVLLGSTYASAETRMRFRIEGEAVARLQHPGIVQVFDFGVANERPFLVMEHMPGGSLADRLARGHRFDSYEAAEFVARLTDAVASAHAAGVTHRDLKPANILLEEPRDRPESMKDSPGDSALVPKVSDFGLAKIDQSDLTRTGALLGTPTHMAPEQAAGRANLVGTSSDVWSLGVILYELLTSKVPFRGETPLDTMYQVVHGVLRPPCLLNREIPPDLDAICRKCLEKRPEDRYLTAVALGEDLRRFASGEPIGIRPPGAVEFVYRWVRRNPAVAALCGVGTVAIGLLIFALIVGLLGLEAFRARDQLRLEFVKAEAALRSAELATQALRLEEQKLAAIEYGRAIQVAHQEVLDQNVANAMAVLQATRPELRGWEWWYVHGLCNGQRKTLFGHKKTVRTAAFSPDSSRVLTASLDATARIWDRATGELLLTLSGHSSRILMGIYSPDGKLVATASADSTARLWDTATGKSLDILEGHNDEIQGIAFSGDGTRLVTASASHIIMWDIKEGKATPSKTTIRDEVDAIISVALSPDGTQLMAGASDGRVRVWNTVTGDPPRILPATGGFAHSVAFSPNGSWAACGSGTSAQVWNAKTWERVSILEGHASSILSVAFSHDSRRVATATQNGSVFVWETEGWPLSRVLLGHTKEAWCVAFSPDGRSIVTASEDLTARIWDSEVAEPMSPPLDFGSGLQTNIESVEWSMDGRRIVAPINGLAVVWNLDSPDPFRAIKSPTGAYFSVALDSKRDQLLMAWSQSEAQIWQISTGKLVQRLTGHTDLVRWACYSPDRARIITASSDRTARVWNAETGDLIQTLDGGSREVLKVDWSHNGRRVVTASANGSVRIWNTETWELIRELDNEKSQVWAVGFSPDGTRLATGSNDQILRIWDVESGHRIHLLKGHMDTISSVGWSPDGTRLVTSSMDHTTRMWDAVNGAEVIVFKRNRALISAAAFSPDGKRLVTAASDRLMRIRESEPTDARFSGYPAEPSQPGEK